MQRIAIIGIGCRFPGGVDERGELLVAARARPLRDRARFPPTAGRSTASTMQRPTCPTDPTPSGAGFSTISAASTRPASASARARPRRWTRSSGCCCRWRARRRATRGCHSPRCARADAGVFIGVSNIDYGLLQRYRPGHGDIQAGTGTALSIVANRVSNRLDLTGPSMGIDTACSSSLVALDTACRHLADGSCDMALAGGVNVLLDPRMFITFSRAHMLSPTGRIRAFDAAADGFVRGEGVGVVLLRRLDDALAAGDRIYAVIEATAVNQDGRTGTITEPSRDAQIAMLRSASSRARASIAGDVAYVEAHGTGTPVGDPIEANAIGAVLGGQARARAAADRLGQDQHRPSRAGRRHRRPDQGGAGAASRRDTAEPRLRAPNPAIEFDALQSRGRARDVRACPSGRSAHVLVNSFGFGGTNACAVLDAAARQHRATQQSPARRRSRVATEPRRSRRRRPIPVPLSAPTPRHLQSLAATLARRDRERRVSRTSRCREIAAALAAQRDHHEHRAVIIASTPDDLRERLALPRRGPRVAAAERHAPPQIIRGMAQRRPQARASR